MIEPINPNDPTYGSFANQTMIFPVGYQLLVELQESTEIMKYKDTLVIPDSVAERYASASVVAKVLQLGPDCYRDTNKYPSGAWCKPNDYVILSPYAGVRIRSSIVPGALRL